MNASDFKKTFDMLMVRDVLTVTRSVYCTHVGIWFNRNGFLFCLWAAFLTHISCFIKRSLRVGSNRAHGKRFQFLCFDQLKLFPAHPKNESFGHDQTNVVITNHSASLCTRSLNESLISHSSITFCFMLFLHILYLCDFLYNDILF